MRPYELLAAAIIRQAALDYRKILIKCKNNPKNEDYQIARTALERFFRSSHFAFLSDLNGEVLMCNIQKTI